MDEAFERLLRDSAASGEPVVLATVLTGPGAGRRLLVWSAGHTFGDLGWPRLNQRVALYAEQLLERGAARRSRRSGSRCPAERRSRCGSSLPSGTAP